MYAHAVNILLAAFLLFAVQPLLGRYILPRYGGAPGVWTVALLFFQVALLAGYAYAHVLTRLARPRVQGMVHGLLVLAGLAFLPIIPRASVPGDAPTLEILWLLLGTIGLPFVMLAATSPLLQFWLGDASRTPRVYRLYAVSNLGSLFALLGNPFLLEPWIGLGAQAWGWSAGYALFALATLFVAWRPGGSVAGAPRGDPPGGLTRVLWVALAGCGVWMLMAVTNRMTLNIAPTPFLWVLPLGLYLLSFVIGFSGRRWYRRGLLLPGMALAVVLFSVAASGGVEIGPVARVVMFAAALLTVCLVLHGELYRLRPDTTRLTGFYLAIAGGGALGGLCVGVIAPRVFPIYWEYEIGQVLCVTAVLGALALDPSSRLRGLKPRWAWAGIALLLLLWIDVYATGMRGELRFTLESRRSFFGVTRVAEDNGVRTLVHGTTNHGMQFTDERAGRATTYFGAGSGVGRVLGRAAPPRRVGIVGLGAGTMAVYGREGDVYRFYELDADVVQLARGHFSYLEDSAAEIEIITGDGRLLLRDEAEQQFDVLILDAFSSGAVPVHLLTLEAFEIYARHLAGNAVVCVNITNHNLDLRPVVAGAARANNWQWAFVDDDGDPAEGTLHSRWAVLSSNLARHGFEPDATEYDQPAWTDDFSNLFRILK
ncbi:MAG: fused MFS/spermidine synthase [Planctomycetes bacterium]|nr:fused MFS/spermidine synthase [Planctomycetota bacterium]